MRTRAGIPLALAIGLLSLSRHEGARAEPPPPAGVRFALGQSGAVGAWLVAGPFRFAGSPAAAKGAAKITVDTEVPGVDDRALTPRAQTKLAASDETTWQVASSEGYGLDLKGALGLTTKDKDVMAYAGLVLEVPRAGRYHLLLGVDDGVRVLVDGRPVLTHDEPRGLHENGDAVALDLSAGPHVVVLKLHQRDGAFGVRARLVDDALRPAGTVLLPGARTDDADRAARRLSLVDVDRGPTEMGYEPVVRVRFPEGMPVAAPLRVSARVVARDGEVIAAAPIDTVPASGPLAGELEIALPPLTGELLAKVEDRPLTIEVDVAGHFVRAPFHPRRATRLAAKRALAALGAVPTARPPWLRPGSFESVDALRRHLLRLVQRGDSDMEAQAEEARELDQAAARLESERDPYEVRTGPMRRAYRSPLDGELAPYALYVPPSYRPDSKRRYPLVVALHGLNGQPMAMLRWFFGGDELKKDQDWEERHWGDLPPLDAFVLVPGGHGNTMYRQLGQDDVFRAMDEIEALYPIDDSRVTITGPSMGGIGAAALAFRRPDRFAAAAPLCGYHSVFVRTDVQGKPMRPWEKFLAEERSNVAWAWNGRDVPLYVVHGTEDLPVENSDVLIERYEALKYSIEHEHPKLGHNVWQPTYENLKGAKWLLGHKKSPHPRAIRFRTARLRDGRDAWAEVLGFAGPDVWGELEARVRGPSRIEATTQGITALRFARDETLVDPKVPTELVIDGEKLVFHPGDDILIHREGTTWRPGDLPSTSPRKNAAVAGPFRDVFHAPLLFVYGTSAPDEARANEEVARAFARIRYGVDVRYPVMSDREFLARGESLANDRALFLVGGAHSNAITSALASELPISVTPSGVTLGGARVQGGGRELGVAFVRPNPKRPDRYLAVVAGTNALGTLRALSLPDLLPDFVVYDERVAPAHGQMILGRAAVLAAGFFGNDWSLPKAYADPLLGRAPKIDVAEPAGEGD